MKIKAKITIRTASIHDVGAIAAFRLPYQPHEWGGLYAEKEFSDYNDAVNWLKQIAHINSQSIEESVLYLNEIEDYDMLTIDTAIAQIERL
jgi:hypothetical protein